MRPLPLVALFLIVAAAGAAETPYVFAVGEARAYTWTLDQEVGWASADDDLRFNTSLRLRLALHVVEATPQRAMLNAAVTRVRASHRGPGFTEEVDSAITAHRERPLLGHLALLEGVVLRLVVDPATGTVAEVGGGDEIARRIAARTRSAIDHAPSPLATQAQAAFAPARLARLWTQLLALPRAAPETFVLDGPASGSIERRWAGDAWTLHLPAGTTALPLTIAPAPTPVTGTLVDLAGGGRLLRVGGWPAESSGSATFTLELAALTQPVRQRHRLAWSLAPTPAGEP
jgi:hypothetical protein